MEQAAGQLDETARRPDAAVTSTGDRIGWRIEIEQGPNQGAVLPLDAGEFSIGTGLSNDIVLADASVAGEQATLSLHGGTATLHPLAPGVTVAGRAIPAGETVTLPAGVVIGAGATVMKMHGPPSRRPWWVWTMLGVPVVLLLTFGSALVGLTSPQADKPPPAPVPAVSPVTNVSATDAASVFEARLREAGLADRIRLTPGAGQVAAEGTLPGPDMQRWADQQVWFDSRYKGTLSLVNRVRPAAAEELPNLRVSAVSTGDTPYIITANGDRFVEGAVVEGGWTVEKIEADKVVLVRNGKRVEMRL